MALSLYIYMCVSLYVSLSLSLSLSLTHTHYGIVERELLAAKDEVRRLRAQIQATGSPKTRASKPPVGLSPGIHISSLSNNPLNSI